MVSQLAEASGCITITITTASLEVPRQIARHKLAGYFA